MINDYNIINSSSNTNQYLKIIRLLQAENLIDVIGVQGHAFSTTGGVSTMKINLDSLASTGLPIQVTEMDINSSDDNVQLKNYQRVFPALYEHPGVEGITLWGWRPGTWQTNAYLLNQDGSERPALEWLRQYLDTLNIVVAIEDIRDVPNEFSLGNNYPNPFNPTTTISYQLPVTSHLIIKVYNLLGKEVATLFEGVQLDGDYVASFDGSGLAGGVYLYQMKARQINARQANNFVETKKFVLLK